MEDPVITRPNSPLELRTFPSSDDDDDPEMIAFRGLSYTSLKDLLPPPSPSSTASPTTGSWKEIPIKDPLLQHAAWAYLQPMAAEERDESETKCCACLSYIVSVLLA